MTMLARLEAPQDFGDRRASDRRLLRLPVAGAIANDSGVDVFIHDLSRSGLLMETRTALQVGDQIEVDLPEAGNTIARVVWSTGQFFGCQFNSLIPAAALSAALLRNPIVRDSRPAEAVYAVTPEAAKTELLPLRHRAAVVLALATAAWIAVFAVVTLI